MKTIHYAGGEVLTSDEIADAVVDYAAALAKRESSAELTIPVILEDGSQSEASLLLGPASQIVARPAVEPAGELVDAPLVDDIANRTAALGPIRAEPGEVATGGGLDEFGLE